MATHYARRDTESLGDLYIAHVEAMTAEGLHEKSAIAAELAWRDAEIKRLRGQTIVQQSNIDRVEAEVYAIMGGMQGAVRLDRWEDIWIVGKLTVQWDRETAILKVWRGEVLVISWCGLGVGRQTIEDIANYIRHMSV